MSTVHVRLTFFSLLIILMVACTAMPQGSTESAVGDSPASQRDGDMNTLSSDDSDESSLILLVAAQGTVRLKRKEWLDYYRTEFGSQLHRGDLLQVQEDSDAVVLCDSLLTRSIPGGAPAGLNNLCPPPQEKILVRGGVLLGNTRGGSDPFIPYIISPRKTKLLNPTPTIRWNPVPNASSYTVAVTGPSVEWQTVTSESSIVYPGEPPLLPGETYAVTVTADTGASSRDEGVQGIGFTMVDAPTADRVEANIARIMELELSQEGKQLALGQYLAGAGLSAEAVEVHEALTNEMPESSSPTLFLGDLYRQSGLNLLAAERYEMALELAEAGDNLEAVALARRGLADVLLSLGERDEAAAVLRDAIDAYAQLGDTEQVEALNQQLEDNGL